jgi:hypothetical protein
VVEGVREDMIRAIFHVSVNGLHVGDIWMDAVWCYDDRLRKHPDELVKMIEEDGHQCAYLELRQRDPDNFPPREAVKAEWFRTDLE